MKMVFTIYAIPPINLYIQPCSYPFPVDSLYGDIDSISICRIDSRVTPVRYFENANKNFYFNVSLAPYDFTKYRITYRQKLLKNKAEYILTTTNLWRKPLETVNYKLTAYNLNLDSISYKPDSILKTKNITTCYWYKTNFMPRLNLVFFWK